MTDKTIVFSPSNLVLKPAPIEPTWVLEGNPEARNRELSHSPDWSAWTMVWECTAGRFQWHYDIDETVHFIDGSVTISGEGMAARRFGPGDVVFFPAGSTATWHVESYVRKVAFCKKVLPAPLQFFYRLYKGLRLLARRMLGRSDKVGSLEPAQ